MVAPTSVLAVELLAAPRRGAVLWCDGRRSIPLPPGARVEVRRSAAAGPAGPAGPAAVHRPAGRQVRPAGARLARAAQPPRGTASSVHRARWRSEPCCWSCGCAGLGVIRDAVLELGPGLTVVTGETGAGKTMVVTGLGLLLGGRADAGAVRGGEPAAVVEGPCGSSRVPGRRPGAPRPAASWTTGTSCSWPGRSSAEGRSRAHVGGRGGAGRPAGRAGRASWSPCTARPSSSGCASPARQREALDRFAGDAVPTPLAGYRAGWTRLRQVRGRAGGADRPGPRTRAGGRAAAAGAGRGRADRPAAGRGRRAARGGDGWPTPRSCGRRGRGRTRRFWPATPDGAVGTPDAAGPAGRCPPALEAVRAARPGLAGAGRPARPSSATCCPTSPPSAPPTPTGVESDPARLAAVEERRAVLGRLTRAHGEDVDAGAGLGRRRRGPAAGARRRRRPARPSCGRAGPAAGAAGRAGRGELERSGGARTADRLAELRASSRRARREAAGR